MDDAIENDTHDRGVSMFGVLGHMLEEESLCYIVGFDEIICEGDSDVFPSDLFISSIIAKDAGKENRR